MILKEWTILYDIIHYWGKLQQNWGSLMTLKFCIQKYTIGVKGQCCATIRKEIASKIFMKNMVHD